MAGGLAGLAVDLLLFPLDTLKTRLQSEQGFMKSGGFNGIYKGLGSVLTGSIPAAAVFFIVYESFKSFYDTYPPGSTAQAAVQALASTVGAVAACIVRVPVEVVKQRSQVSLESDLSSLSVFRATLAREGVKGLYRGLIITAIRDSAFSLLEFPIWEQMKTQYALSMGLAKTTPLPAACLGAVAGSIAAFATTPVDVAKTQMMLAESDSLATKLGFFQSIARVYSQSGIQGLFSGAVPRVCWISIGGFIFLGVYDSALVYFSTGS